MTDQDRLNLIIHMANASEKPFDVSDVRFLLRIIHTQAEDICRCTHHWNKHDGAESLCTVCDCGGFHHETQL